MGKVLINDTTLTNIGNAIRTKTGKSELLLPSEMPKEIESISGGSSFPENGIFGIKRDITSISPEWERTDDAVDMVAFASIGTHSGYSDFDNVMPYKGIARETLPTGDVMVKIPKFYYRRYREGNVEFIKISAVPQPQFELHPAFNHGDVEKDCVYIGAYKTSTENMSATQVTLRNRITRDDARTSAQSKGTGWGITDISIVSAVQMLFLVEFANNNSQELIGGGNVNNGGVINTGSTDAIPNLTGRPIGSTYYIDNVYRGIEGFWGNVFEYVDGLNWNNGEYWICNNPQKYATSTTENYIKLSYNGTTSFNGYISEMGFDETNPFVMLPIKTERADSHTGFCDNIWSGGGWKNSIRGGGYGFGEQCGLFAFSFADSPYSADGYTGSRLVYIPQN